jgi:REP element-mobilizing transposase RayT
VFQDIAVRNRGYLPHWERSAGGYFVTFRLADSLPTAVLKRIRSEALRDVRAIEQTPDILAVDKRTLLAQLTAQKVEHHLDLGVGACHLAKSQIAEVVVSALQYFHEKRYRLQAWCVMPNHVHILFQLFPEERLSSLLHSWKSFTAKECSGILGTSGAFWQKEYYDHLVRNEGDLRRIAQYIVENPAKAGLRDWQWMWVDESLGGHK